MQQLALLDGIKAEKRYLWVNLLDLDAMGRLPPLGSVINLLIRKESGDVLLPGCYMHPKRVDDNFIVLELSPERAQAIADCLELMSLRKINRVIRMRKTAKLPGKAWNWQG